MEMVEKKLYLQKLSQLMSTTQGTCRQLFAKNDSCRFLLSSTISMKTKLRVGEKVMDGILESKYMI